jgi:hypothetical protein
MKRRKIIDAGSTGSQQSRQQQVARENEGDRDKSLSELAERVKALTTLHMSAS